jgi:photosystem II stability/assembly factor-like uncharacterized protein
VLSSTRAFELAREEDVIKIFFSGEIKMPSSSKRLVRLGVGVILLSLTVLSLAGCGEDGGAISNRNNTGAGSAMPNSSTPAHTESASELVIPQIRDAAFIGTDSAWLFRRQEGNLLTTVNGGTTWETLAAANVDKNTAISFIDSSKGWLVKGANGSLEVSRTIDGGRQWTTIGTVSPTDSGEPLLSPIQIDFVDESHGWLIETFTVWQTADGGAKWEEVLSIDDPRITGQPGRGFFMNQKAWICGSKGQLYSTTNGGKTWQIQTIDDSLNCSDVFFVDEQTGWLSRNSNGQLYRSEDGGRSWHLQPALGQYLHIDSCYFLSKTEGWGVGQQLLEGSRGLLPFEYIAKGLAQGVAMHTVDGGRTWQTSLVEKTEPFFQRTYFGDPERGWIISRNNVYRTTDGGRSWKALLDVRRPLP